MIKKMISYNDIDFILRRCVKIIFSLLLLGFLYFQSTTLAVSIKDDPFVLIPEAKDKNYGQKVQKLGDPSQTKGNFWQLYNDQADAYVKAKDANGRLSCDLGAMLSSGIVTRDTILCLLVRIVKVIANLALVVGSAMIVYAGYLYATAALSGGSVDDTGKANEAVKDAIIGIVVVVFSYAIQKIVTQAFLS